MTAIEELMRWDGCDAIINLGIMGRRIMVKRFGEWVLQSDPQYDANFIGQVNRQYQQFEKEYVEHIVRQMEKFQKPVLGVSLLPDEKNKTLYRVRDSEFKGVFYPTPERAVKSIAKMVDYNQFLKKNRKSG